MIVFLVCIGFLILLFYHINKADKNKFVEKSRSNFISISLVNEKVENFIIDESVTDFVVFDFETANKEKNSAVSLGLCFVKNLTVVEAKEFLIRPNHEVYFEFTYLHGISWKDVVNEKKFSDLWDDLEDVFRDNLMIAYNARFDIDVLTNTLNSYLITLPNVKVSCALQLSRQHIKGLANYKLVTVAKHFDIDFNSHEASQDAYATSMIVINIINQMVEKNKLLAKKIELQKRKADIIELKKNPEFAKQIENIARNIRRSKLNLSKNPDSEVLKQKYNDYKEAYLMLTGYEYKEVHK